MRDLGAMTPKPEGAFVTFDYSDDEMWAKGYIEEKDVSPEVWAELVAKHRRKPTFWERVKRWMRRF